MKIKTCGTCENKKGCREFGVYGPMSNRAEKCKRYLNERGDKMTKKRLVDEEDLKRVLIEIGEEQDELIRIAKTQACSVGYLRKYDSVNAKIDLIKQLGVLDTEEKDLLNASMDLTALSVIVRMKYE